MRESSAEPVKTGAAEPFPWEMVLSWLILGYGVVSLVSFSIFSYVAPEYVPLWPRLINPLLQGMFVVAAWLLLTRMRLALPLFAVHLVASFLHVAQGAPELLFTPNFVAKWVLSLGVLTFVILRWRALK